MTAGGGNAPMPTPGEPPNPYAVGSSMAGAPARDPALNTDPPPRRPRWLAVLVGPYREVRGVAGPASVDPSSGCRA